MKSEVELLKLSIKDFFTAKMLRYSIAPFIFTMLIMYLLFFTFAGLGLDQLGTMDVQSTQTTMENGIPHTESTSTQLEGSSIATYLMSFAATSWLVVFFVYTVGAFFVLYLSIFVALLVIGFMTPMVLKEIQARHYPDVEMIGHSNLLEALFLTLKWALGMLLLFLVLIPTYFIPLLNIVALNLPLYYFFHKMMSYDIASTICTREESKKIKFFSANQIRLKTLALYLLSLIPFVIFFAAIFFVIYLGHTYFVQTRAMRNERD